MDYVTVPREPTEAMVSAGDDAIIYNPDDIIRNQADRVWSAMLAAAPTEAVERAPVTREDYDRLERAIRLADTLTADVPVTVAALGHVREAYAALARLLALIEGRSA